MQDGVSVLDQARGGGWCLYQGDTCEVIKGLPDASVDLSIHSPPFASLFVYSASDRDLGNSRDRDEFVQHYRYVIGELLRVTRPGRNASVHVAQVATTLAHDGVIGLTDFRGDVIRAYVAEGWVYHGEITIDKNPQQQAIRTHAKALLFAQLRKDASWLRPGLADYILIFRKPGDNTEPIVPDITNEEWISWAHPVWYDVRESDTLNVAAGRGEQDERHICPLQLPVIERCVRLWSNPGEVVFDPFCGIGSTPVVALRQGRRGLGIELKESYYRTAVANCEQEQLQGQMSLFAASASA